MAQDFFVFFSRGEDTQSPSEIKKMAIGEYHAVSRGEGRERGAARGPRGAGAAWGGGVTDFPIFFFPLFFFSFF